MSFWRDRRVLVTGGCGFLGSYLVEELVGAAARVRVVDNLETGKLANLSNVADAVEFVNADLVEMQSCLRVAADCEIVMNLVGKTEGVGYSSSHHGEMLYYNTTTQLNMLEAARLSGVRRFLVVSSSCVYPDDAPIPTPELPVLQGLPESGNEGYGWAKRIAELQATFYQREYGMEIAICRPFNPYGGRYLWRGEERSHVLPTLVKKIMDGQTPLVVWGSGAQRRNFLHARDTARLMMLITEHHAHAEPVNIGYAEDVSIIDLVGLICEVSGRSPDIVFDRSKPEGRLRKCVDPTLLNTVSGGYQPQISLRDGIDEMIEWHRRTFGVSAG